MITIVLVEWKELNSNWRGFVGEGDHEIIDSEYIKSFKEFFFETKEKIKVNAWRRVWGQGEGSLPLSDKLKYNIFYANWKVPA